jgi:predicted nucleic acid-binding protein
MTRSVYWDPCVFVDLLQQTPGRFEACEGLRQQAARGDFLIATSALTLAEVGRLPASGLAEADLEAKVFDFFENDYVAVRQVDRATALRANQLTRSHGLSPAEAIHIATALLARSEVFYTFDAARGRRKGLLAHDRQIGSPPLRIEVPVVPPPGPLWQTRR